MATVVDEKLAVYKGIQEDIQKLFTQKQQTLSQFNENTLVKGELDMLEDSGKVFKLVGPVLMAVELQESRANVGKRLEFIEAEIKKVDNNIAVKQGEAASLGDEIALAQKAMQMEAAKAAQAIAAGAA
ncbi:Prefoldin [Ochromonadaceae sp. CCMP2298]|nr:Prefoldin [Ochromonadaceae sp. CCMP2298]|mmetsp:Transcript_33071/g.72847  ORF Transcript_33071/g.72847 Transcript_33071/m.72847 type:complete len:128 (+) Transcript_33071:72-455(+)|eukprot:CAMPEP_0173202658 /NCGR_PEP_ID=MMETSP1141-20130122/19095_1 /TAXON_ID=483371 /ORGANISM="non described non described, Strain CCMP2298" /LENGTH=127 /DNA_ID=CAMNT_0014128047 /DNA_START=73 /DNA_END=456 /DNA_ORIENTATION=-